MIEPDIEAIITCKRKTPFYNGYRPDHLVNEDYLTTGTHQYYGLECIPTGDSALGTITFITPEAYPHCLWEGKSISIHEGIKIVGCAVIIRIFNNLLKKE